MPSPSEPSRTRVRRAEVSRAWSAVRSSLLVTGPGWQGRCAWVALSIPAGLLSAGLFLGLVVAVVLTAQGIGVVLLVVLLATARGLGGVERRLARRLLGLDVVDEVRLRREPGAVRRLRRLVLSASTWRTLAWLGVRVLLGAGVLATVVSAGGGLLALAVDAPWSRATAVPLLAVGALVVLLALAALELHVRVAALAASRLLGTAPEDRLVALQQTSQRLADRNRLARDLHDTIGHALTASLLQATAAARTLAPDPADPAAPVDPAFARQALAHIETNTRSALSELDRALAVLRDEHGARSPEWDDSPDLGALDDLLAGLRDGGLPVELVVDGPLTGVPDDISRLGYRVVQEATTNVLRHAGSPSTTVRIARHADVLHVCVGNAPSAAASPRPGPGGGRGLAGLRERAAAVGGQLVAGETPGGGFEVRASLPVGARR